MSCFNDDEVRCTYCGHVLGENHTDEECEHNLIIDSLIEDYTWD